MKILVTGGLGYIGSHTVNELLKRDYEVIVIDNLCNSKESVKDDIESISKKEFKFVKADVRDREALRNIFKEDQIEAVIHFAGLKAVGESVEKPIEYYDNNIGSTIALLEVMKEFDCKKIIFSSSATVYGNPEKLPITEDMKVGGTTNPYGTSKLMIEKILQDLYIADKNFEVTLLRYFNPIGAEETGTLGEDPNGIPNNLMPYIMRVATGEYEFLSVFGDDYNTVDGTGVRDYIHVVDLAVGHIKAIEHSKKGVNIYNLGTGRGTSVLELVKAYEKASGKEVPYKISERRPGDIDACYADPSKAKLELDWEAKYNINDMCTSTFNYSEKLKNK